MENDQGRFRAVVMGMVHISIVSIPPLGASKLKERETVLREWTGKETKITKLGRNKKKFETKWNNTHFFLRKTLPL